MTPSTPVDFERLAARFSDPTPWDLDAVGVALGMRTRNVLILWNNTRRYLEQGLREWPPSKPEAEQGVAPVTWWPPDIMTLPAPDFPGPQPRWRAGTIRRYAVAVGRMTMDGSPVVPRGRPANPKSQRAPGSLGVTAPPPTGPEPDFHAARVMVEDSRLWRIADIRAFFGVGEEMANRWVRSCRNLLQSTKATWPPTKAQTATVLPASRQGGVTWWPPVPNALPAPAQISEDGRYVWRAGDVKAWGLATGRLRFDGVVQSPTSPVSQ